MALALWAQYLPLSLALLITTTHNWPYNRERAHDTTCCCCWELYLVSVTVIFNWKSRKIASLGEKCPAGGIPWWPPRSGRTNAVGWCRYSRRPTSSIPVASPMDVSNRFCRRLRGTSCFRGAYGGRVTGLPMLKAGRRSAVAKRLKSLEYLAFFDPSSPNGILGIWDKLVLFQPLTRLAAKLQWFPRSMIEILKNK